MIPGPSTVPNWRLNARAGIALAAAREDGGSKMEDGSQSVPSSPFQSTAPVPPSQRILSIVRPSARDRWQSGLLSYYTHQNVENTIRGAMSGNLTAQWLMFDLMEQTWPRLSKNFNELKLSACACNRIIQPFADKDEKPTAEAVRRAKIVDKLVRTMRPNRKKLERDLDDTLYDALDAVGKGIELSEILWEDELQPVRLGTETLLLWVPRATRWVHPRYYGYPPYSDRDEELMLNTREIAFTNPEFQTGGGNADSAWIPIPEDQFIVSIIQQKSGHPINASMLRILGLWWAASNFTWEWFLNFAQIFGAPIRWANFDPATSTQETINLIQEMLAQMGSLGWGLFPTGTNLELKEATKSGQDNPQVMLLAAADLICDLVVFWESMTSEHGGAGGKAGGTQGQAVVGENKRTQRIQSVANTGARILNETLIPAICRLNFGDDRECPKLLIVTKANKDLVQQATRYQILLQTPGVQISRQQFYEDNELTLPDENDDVIEGGLQIKTGSPANPQDFGGAGRGEDPSAAAHAKAGADEALLNNVLENLTGVEARWLGDVKPSFRELLAKAKDDSVSDADLVKAIEHAQKHMPELFHKLDSAALAQAMENSMAAALVNGAVRGYVQRGNSKLKTQNSKFIGAVR